MTPFWLGALAASLTLLVGPAPVERVTAPPHDGTGASPTGVWPLATAAGAGYVLRPFDDPLPYAAGHTGVDLASRTGQPVVSTLAGRVTVAGTIAGRPLVVVEHADGIRTTYLPIDPSVRVGERVSRGEQVGHVAALRHCNSPALSDSPALSPFGHTSCLHWGARDGERYIDPRTLVPDPAGPIVLLPLAGP